MSNSILELAQKNLKKRRDVPVKPEHPPSKPTPSRRPAAAPAPKAGKGKRPGPAHEKQLKSIINEVKTCFIDEVRNILTTELNSFRNLLCRELQDNVRSCETLNSLPPKIEEILASLGDLQQLSEKKETGVEKMVEKQQDNEQAPQEEASGSEDNLVEILEESADLETTNKEAEDEQEMKESTVEDDSRANESEELPDSNESEETGRRKTQEAEETPEPDVETPPETEPADNADAKAAPADEEEQEEETTEQAGDVAQETAPEDDTIHETTTEGAEHCTTEDQKEHLQQIDLNRFERFIDKVCNEINAVSEHVRSEVTEIPNKVAKVVAKQMANTSHSEYLKAVNISLSSLHEAVEDLQKKDKTAELRKDMQAIQAKLESIENRLPELQA